MRDMADSCTERRLFRADQSFPPEVEATLPSGIIDFSNPIVNWRTVPAVKLAKARIDWRPFPEGNLANTNIQAKGPTSWTYNYV